MNPQRIHTSVVALWELALQWMAIYYFVVLVRFFLVSYFLCFVLISFAINRLCDEGINGKDQRAEKILLSLATNPSKDRGQMVAYISESTSLDGPS